MSHISEYQKACASLTAPRRPPEGESREARFERLLRGLGGKVKRASDLPAPTFTPAAAEHASRLAREADGQRVKGDSSQCFSCGIAADAASEDHTTVAVRYLEKMRVPFTSPNSVKLRKADT